MFKTLSAALILAGASLLASPTGQATVLFGNFNPSDTPATEQNVFLPLKHRAPAPPNLWDTYTGDYTYLVNCCNIRGENVTTEFTAPIDFTASRIIMPLAYAGGFADRRIGFNIEHFDEASATWTGLGFAQVIVGLLGSGIVEADVPFGNTSSGRFQDFVYMPITFEAGELYRIRTNLAAGGIGYLNWYLSDAAAAPGQSESTAFASGPTVVTTLTFQPAFAFTDGGDLHPAAAAPATVPAPGSLAFLIPALALLARRCSARLPQ